MTWLAIGIAVGLACGGALMTWWSSRRIEREAARQYEMGIAEGVRIAEREQSGSGRRTGNASDRQRRRKALRSAGVADDVTA